MFSKWRLRIRKEGTCGFETDLPPSVVVSNTASQLQDVIIGLNGFVDAMLCRLNSNADSEIALCNTEFDRRPLAVAMRLMSLMKVVNWQKDVLERMDRRSLDSHAVSKLDEILDFIDRLAIQETSENPDKVSSESQSLLDQLTNAASSVAALYTSQLMPDFKYSRRRIANDGAMTHGKTAEDSKGHELRTSLIHSGELALALMTAYMNELTGNAPENTRTGAHEDALNALRDILGRIHHLLNERVWDVHRSADIGVRVGECNC